MTLLDSEKKQDMDVKETWKVDLSYILSMILKVEHIAKPSLMLPKIVGNSNKIQRGGN